MCDSPFNPPCPDVTCLLRCCAAKVLETREEVEETDDPARLRQLLQDNLQAQAHVVRSLSASFREQAWEHAAKHATELAYLVRLQQEISHKLPL